MQALQLPQQQACSSRPQCSQNVRRAARVVAHSSHNCNSCSTSLAGQAALSAAAAAVVLQLCSPAAPAFAALPASSSTSAAAVSTSTAATLQPVYGDLSISSSTAPELPAEQEEYAAELLTEEVAMPPELYQFMEMIQKGDFNDLKRLQDARRSVGFERSPDGRVFLFTEDGEPFQVKNDMGVPGLLLLRDAGGFCYYLPRAESEALQQIDLSDDAVVAQLFANHAWEELVEPLEIIADAPEAATANSNNSEQEMGRLEQLRLTEREFRSVVSLVAGGEELPEEPLERLEGQEMGM